MNGWALYEELVARNPTSLTPHQLDLVAFSALRTEVNNGGFDQYFFNSGGDLAPEAVAVTRSLQLDNLADLIARAMAAFGDYPTDRVVRQERLEQMTAEGRTFETHDEEYYALEMAVDLDSAMNVLATRV